MDPERLRAIPVFASRDPQTSRTASVVATSPMRLITLTRWDLRRAGDPLEQIRATIEERRPAAG